MRAGPPTMSHIDSANQELCAQLLRLCYSVSMLRRLPIYVRSTFTLRKLLFGCYCTYFHSNNCTMLRIGFCLWVDDMYCTLPKINPLPSLISKFLHRYFTSFISPHFYTAKSALSAKINKRVEISNNPVIHSLCLLHLLALSAKRHG